MKPPELEFLKRFFQQVADRPLDPASDTRYVPLYTDPDAVAEDPVQLLARAIQWSAGESVQLLSGFRGTGKSTELRRLRSTLSELGYCVALVDIEDFVNLTTKIDVTDFLVALAGAFGEAISTSEVLGDSPIKESYWDRFVAFLTRTKVDISEAGASVGAKDVGVAIKANLKSDPTFRQRVQERMAGHLGALVADVRAFFEDCVRRIKEVRGAETEVVLLVDSVEHIRATSVSAAEEVQASVETLFAGHADALRIPNVHVIYTVPPYLKVRYPNLGMLYDAGAVQIFPAVKVTHHDTGKRHDGGVRALRRVVEKRGDPLRLFGTEERLCRIIVASGGHLRDLLRLLAEVLRRATALPVDDRTVDAAINQIRTEFLPIPDVDAQWLARIARTHQASLVDKDHLPDLARFLDTHVVLCYRNGPEWYDVHPLIKEHVMKQASELEKVATAEVPREIGTEKAPAATSGPR